MSATSTYIDTRTFVKKLKKRGVTYRTETLIDLAKSGIISDFRIISQEGKALVEERGRRPSSTQREGKRQRRPGPLQYEWGGTAIEDACGAWAVQNLPTKTNLPNKRLKMIKAIADHAHKYPSAFYEFPKGVRITGPEPTSQWRYSALRMMVFPDPEVDARAKTWIIAGAKAKRGKDVSVPKKVVFYWRSRLSVIKSFRIGADASSGQELLEALKRTLPSLEEEDIPSTLFEEPFIAFPHDTTRMVRSPGNPRGWELRPLRWEFYLEDIKLEDAERDDLIFLLDGRDSRIKALYAPYDEYDPSIDYEERAGGLDERGQIKASALRDAGIDTLINETRSLIDEVNPLLTDIARNFIEQETVSAVFALVHDASKMPLVRWRAPPAQKRVQ